VSLPCLIGRPSTPLRMIRDEEEENIFDPISKCTWEPTHLKEIKNVVPSNRVKSLIDVDFEKRL
jgi:hypothetical protein